MQILIEFGILYQFGSLIDIRYNPLYVQLLKSCKFSASSENKLFVDLLREMQKYDEVITRTQLDPEMLSCGEPSYERATTENSVYSSAANGGTKQDIHVKIVKVTNVYRVAYLRQLIKQKRLRRANRQALLRKKVCTICIIM